MLNCRSLNPCRAIALGFALSVAVALPAQNGKQQAWFEVRTHRMDVDVDGAPNAYGPAGVETLDILENAHYLNRTSNEIVGYLIDEKGRPVVQGLRCWCLSVPSEWFPLFARFLMSFAETSLRG